MQHGKQTLGQMLVAANLIDEVQMQIALAEQRQTGKRFGSTLVDLKFIDENVLAAFLSRQIDVPCISLLHIDIPKKVLRKMNRNAALDCQAIPVRVEGERLEVAMVDPTDADTVMKVERVVAMPVSPLIAPESSIQTMIERFYPDEERGEDTLRVKRLVTATGDTVTDPIFLDIIEELEATDLDRRLARMERSLDQIWSLLEKVLRTLEISEKT
jgi:type IV pilus assembly protein PilB